MAGLLDQPTPAGLLGSLAYNYLIPDYLKPMDEREFRRRAGIMQYARGGAKVPQVQPDTWEAAARTAIDFMPGGPAGPMTAIFAGPAARTANKAALAQAEKMAATGADKRAIWDATGWFRGADDKWRFEIDDRPSAVRDVAMRNLDGPEGYIRGMASGVFGHDDLYKAYPDIRRTDVTLAKQPGSSGYFSAADNQMYSEGPDAAGIRDVLLHEMQHGAQNAEGFARGGSPRNRDFQSIAQDIAQRGANRFAELDNAKRAWQLDWVEKQGIPSSDMDYTQWLARAAREWKREFPEQARALDQAFGDMEMRGATAVYRRLGGEVEARNVQKRKDMTPEQRRATPPWETEDVPREQQIVRMLLEGR